MTSEFSPDHGVRFEVSGQFAHFRDIFTQAFFQTLLGPPRPTILGMIGAALGFSETNTIELGKKVLVGVRIIEIKGFANEVTTAHNLKLPELEDEKEWPIRTPVLRSILVEPRYEVCVVSEDRVMLLRIAESLRAPRYPLYLGISDFLAYVTRVDEAVSRLKRGTSKTVGCVAPITHQDRFNVRLKGPISGFHMPPQKSHTIHSFTLSPEGRKPERYIDLLMFFNCEVEFNQEKEVYKLEDGAGFCVF
jgi:CRISPR-associated protein Cas5 subtype I-B